MYDEIFTLYYKKIYRKQSFSIKINNICYKKAVKCLFYLNIILFTITTMFLIILESIIIVNKICDKCINNYQMFAYSALVICPVFAICMFDKLNKNDITKKANNKDEIDKYKVRKHTIEIRTDALKEIIMCNGLSLIGNKFDLSKFVDFLIFCSEKRNKPIIKNLPQTIVNAISAFIFPLILSILQAYNPNIPMKVEMHINVLVIVMNVFAFAIFGSIIVDYLLLKRNAKEQFENDLHYLKTQI